MKKYKALDFENYKLLSLLLHYFLCVYDLLALEIVCMCVIVYIFVYMRSRKDEISFGKV